MTTFDEAALEWFDPIRHPLAVDVFAWITELGTHPALVVAVMIAAAFLCVQKQFAVVAGFLTTILGSQILLWTIKLGVGRARLEFITDITASSPSFPSGHTAGALSIYGFLAYALIKVKKGR